MCLLTNKLANFFLVYINNKWEIFIMEKTQNFLIYWGLKISVKDQNQNYYFIRDSSQNKNVLGSKCKIGYLLGIKNIFKSILYYLLGTYIHRLASYL